MLSSGKLTPSTIPHLHLNGAQSLQPLMAYGLQALCLRLTPTVTGIRSRLDNRCGGSPLSVQYFQLLVNRRLVAHQIWMQFNTRGSEGFQCSQNDGFRQTEVRVQIDIAFVLPLLKLCYWCWIQGQQPTLSLDFVVPIAPVLRTSFQSLPGRYNFELLLVRPACFS